MAQKTIFRPTITAGTRQTRSFKTLFHGVRYPYRTALQVYNRSAARVDLYVHGELVRQVNAGDLVVFDEDSAIHDYQLDASANTAADEVEVFEDGGLDESVESQRGA